MPFIDVPTLLQPIHPDSPCGPDLEYAPLYLEAARAMEGRPDAQYGSVIVAAVDPDWALVKAATLDLLAQSHDLRLAVWLARALVALHGAAAIADGCALVEGLLTQHWDHVHPQLDADDDCDPTARLNTLVSLDDQTGMVRELSLAPLVVSPNHGPVCLRDIEAAQSEPDESNTAPDPAFIDAVFADSPYDALSQVCDALASASASLDRIDARLTERLGHGRSIALRSLEQVLARAHQAVQAHLARRPFLDGESHAVIGAPALTRGEAQDSSQAIASRVDVLRSLDQLCAYYALAEPSSPVPVLLQRARTLVGKGFVDIVSDLTPSGADQARHWAGPEQA